MALTAPGRGVHIDCSRTPYQMLASDSFYSEAQRLVTRSGSVALQLGVSVRPSPRRVEGGWLVETDVGRVTARRVLDTRPPRPLAPDDAVLWQSFCGQEVECDTAVFDSATVDLMEFEPGRDDGVHFTYVLPLSPHRALIETTVFGPQPLPAPALAAAQAAAVDRRCAGAAFRVCRAEHGVLPMGTTAEFPAPGPGYRRAGLLAGAARPSTGYAFQRIQRWADASAAAIARGGSPVVHGRDPVVRRAMDRLFLRVLRAHPARAPELFVNLFGRTDPARVIRFLSDRATLADCAMIGTTLPIALFVGELFRGRAEHARRMIGLGRAA